MGSAYGDILVHFPELRIEIPYFEQTANIGAGYTAVGESRNISVIRQTGPGRRLSGTTRSDFNAISPVLKINDNLDIWTEEKLTVGWFVAYENEVYRIVRQYDWLLEAGFYGYGLEKVVGNDGSTDVAVDLQVVEV